MELNEALALNFVFIGRNLYNGTLRQGDAKTFLCACREL